MSYDKKKIYEQSLQLVREKELLYIEDIVSFLPISKPTFYEYFPPDSNELNAIKNEIDSIKISIKSKLRKKWKESDAPALQIALYKLIATDEEGAKINSQKTEIEHTFKEKLKVGFDDDDAEKG